MKSLLILALLAFMCRRADAAIYHQISASLDVDTTLRQYAIKNNAGTDTTITIVLDNVITYKSRYYLSTEDKTAVPYTTQSAASVAVMFTSNFLYRYIVVQDSTSSAVTITGPTEDNVAAVVPDAKKFAQYFRPIFKKEATQPYLIFNLQELGLACDANDTPPVLNYQVKYYSSEEEAKSVFDSLSSQLLGVGAVAWVDLEGECYDLAASGGTAAGVLKAAYRICDLIKGTEVLCGV